MSSVSVIIPNYNHARYLRQRIESVLAQSFTDYELIIMDDASTDQSRSIIQEYATQPCVSQIILNDANSGSTFKQWNKGVQLAKGKYIWIAESDDYADSAFLEKTVAIIERQANISLVFCESFLINETSEVTGNTRDWQMPHERWNALAGEVIFSGIDFCKDYLTARCAIPNASAVLFSKRYYQTIGGADENFRMSGDWKLWFNMLFAAQGGYIGEPLNYFRSHNQTVRTTKEYLQKEEALYNLKQFHRQLLSVGQTNRQMLEYIFLWSFKKNPWTKKFNYSLQNIKTYFKNPTWEMVYFFCRHKLVSIFSTHIHYRLKNISGYISKTS